MEKEFTITEESAKLRLDKYLTEQLEISRNKVQNMIKAGQVLVNNNTPSVHQFLKKHDQVIIQEKTPAATSTQELPLEKTARTLLMPKVLAEEQDYLIIEKPAGLLVHPTLKQEKFTLVNWLVKNYPELKKIGEDPNRPAIVHRLDRKVSGLMIIPRTQNAFDYFKTQFKMRKIKKQYIALVHGKIETDDGLIDFPITRSKEGKFVALPKGSEQGKKAETEFEFEKRWQNYTLLKIKPLTGRTNQIRIHLNAYGHPIVGDSLYSGKIKNSKIEIDRTFLHASRLSFFDLSGQKKVYESALPKRLKAVLEKLK
jgi:23S rRNA pseudouridine1911/1915/1917 synthase